MGAWSTLLSAIPGSGERRQPCWLEAELACEGEVRILSGSELAVGVMMIRMVVVSTSHLSLLLL